MSEDLETKPVRDDEDEDAGNLGDLVRWAQDLLVRRRWVIGAAAFVVTLAAIGIIRKLPNRYQSQATLILQRERIPQRFAESFAVANAEDELNAIAREVLSRRRLIQIIDATGLYADLRAKLPPDALAETMRKAIKLEPVKSSSRTDITAFQLSFIAGSATLAQDVVTRLANLFIEENLRTQDDQTATTGKFLTQQLEAAKQRLEQQEAKVRDFKTRNLGELPEQQSANISALTEARIELQGHAARLARVRQQRVELESSLSGFVARTESEKNALLAKYTPKHPDIVRKERDIEQARAILKALGAESAPPPFSVSAAGPEDPWLAQTRRQAQAVADELEAAARDEQRARAQIAQLQGKINLIPLREQQMSALMRDLDSYQKDYNDLLAKQLRYQQTISMEEQRHGAQYRLVEPPDLPIAPVSPKRLQLSLGAAGAGLAAGLILAYLLDLLKNSFRTENEIKKHLRAPLVISLPLIQTRSEIRRRRRFRILEVAAGSAMAAVVALAEFYVYRNP
jgi:polysaccharide chain length determinant protein (PEP-CTERM system associated)